MKKAIAVLLSVTLAAGTLIGCSSGSGKKDVEEKKGGKEKTASEKVITFNIGQEPTTLDPGLNSGNDGTLVLNHLYEGLMIERDGKFECAAAESYDVSDDGKEYTFHLRDNKWSDGEPVRAQDFEFAWKRALDPEVASTYSWIFESGGVESFKAVDDKTLEVTLNSNNPVFLSLLANTTFFPLREDKIDYLNGAWALDPEKVVTNGAFKMTEYKAGDRLVMEKNENYHDIDNVKVDKIVALMIVDQTTALTAYESGDIDAITEVPPAEKPRLLSEDPNFMVSPLNSTNFYAFNVTKAPFDNVNVRKALSYAIDRTAIVTDVLKGGEEPAHSLIPSVVLDNDGNVFNEVSGDYGIPKDNSKVEGAKKLLADAGYPNGEGFPKTELLYNTNEKNKAVAEAIQQQWKENLNIDVTLVNMESSVFHQTRVAHDFDVCRGGWYGDYNDPLTHLELYTSDNSMNYAGWKDPEYDKLVTEAKVSSGKERFDKFYEAEKLLMESYAYMPISYDVYTCLINQDRVSGFEILSTGVYRFINADVTE